MATILTACAGNHTEKQNETPCRKMQVAAPQPGDVMASVNLTVAEGKRLIAKGIAAYQPVQEKLTSGMVIITRGSTNTYIAEELAGLDAPNGAFMTGRITPEGRSIQVDASIGEIVLVDGKRVEMSYPEALAQMRPGDIVFKGANMLNYALNQAAVCVGAPDGGTVGKLRPYTAEPGKGQLIVPVGLEKEVPGDLREYEKLFGEGVEKITQLPPRVLVHQNAILFTEIEALKTLAGVQVAPYAAGGLSGREGGISLAVYGPKAEVEKALAVVAAIQGEPAF